MSKPCRYEITKTFPWVVNRYGVGKNARAELLCPRVGYIQRFRPGGRFELGMCGYCGKPLWVDLDLVDALEADGFPVRETRCEDSVDHPARMMDGIAQEPREPAC
jgi:hypothetical protein